jgi:ATP-binding cassette ChvD family protein
MRSMAGVDSEFDGTCQPLRGKSVGYLPQEPTLEGETVGESIAAGVASGKALLSRYEELSTKLTEPLDDDEMSAVMEEFASVQEKIEAGNLWELDRIVERASLALRCPPDDAKVAVLSGGEKRRVALARLLLENHDMLLLDEPTNHLDAQSIAWLQTYLDEYPGTVLAITHDRYFLEETCKWILELERGEGKPFEGSYSDWLEKKAELMRQQKQQDTKLQKTLENELEWVRSNAKAKQTKSKARLKNYDEMVMTPEREGLAHSATIYVPPGPRLGEKVIQAANLRKGFGDRLLIDDLTFSLPRGGIVGIIGPNGAGKTTLIKMLKGEEAPDGGELELGDTVKLVAVDQTREGLKDDNSVFDEVTNGDEKVSLGETVQVNSRSYVGWFGFKGGDQSKKVAKLSGGERNRVQLAKLLKSGANVLLMDEPTNDLDVDTMRSLEEGLLDFAGCAVIVSHDRYFLDRLCTHILAAEGEGKWTWFEGNFEEYEADRKVRLGDAEPKPLKYAKLAA